MATSEIKKTLDPSVLAPTINAITLMSVFSSSQGGYYKIGKIVIVNFTAVAGTFGANDYFTITNSLPNPSYSTALSVTTTSDAYKGAEAYLDVYGVLKIKSGATALTDQRIVVTGAYIAA